MPAELITLHARVGSVPEFMTSFEQFAPPEAWEVIDEHLMFLSENQDVCAWGVDAQGAVWMQPAQSTFHPEEISLPDFLTVLLPYQLAQGGWALCATRSEDAAGAPGVVAEIAGALDWPLLAIHSGLTIYGGAASFAWTLNALPGQSDADVFLSSRDEAEFQLLCERFDFVEL